MSPREMVTQKARRYLTSGALTVLEVTPGIVRAACRGDSGRLHRCCWWRGSWGCSCAAGQLRGACSHLAAEPAGELPPLADLDGLLPWGWRW